MRPKNFKEFVGQKHLVSKKAGLRTLIEKNQISSMVLWGPPGCGKTSLAYLIASVTHSHFEYLSAVEATLGDLRRIIQEAKIRLKNEPEKVNRLKLEPEKEKPQRTILTVDEIHRWTKSQQSALLPYVEDGTIILIACTTENPYFEIIAPLLSRSTVYKLSALNPSETKTIIKKALKLENARVDPKTLSRIADYSNGDARRALNILEAALTIARKKGNQNKKTTLLAQEIIQEAIQQRTVLYDKDRDAHYDTISAFIKSMRGSDPDAAIFYLVKMLKAGEDPEFIVRRIMIFASEDIGNADPNALTIAASAFEAVQKVGLPEAELALAQAVIYMACAPKSNAAYQALIRAKQDLEQRGAGEVPLFLRNPSHPELEKHHYGKGYQYPHLFPEGYAPSQEYLPKHLRGTRYYFPTERGYEKIIKARLEYWRKLKKLSTSLTKQKSDRMEGRG